MNEKRGFFGGNSRNYLKQKMLFTMTLTLAVAISAVSMVLTKSYASTESAWQNDKQEIVSKCIKASQLSQTKAASEIIYYDDEVGFAALALSGIYPQKHMNKRPGKELCLFDRKKRAAYVSVADEL
jgi:hypothetical protein